MASRDISVVEVNDESWVLDNNGGTLGLYKSQSVDETGSPAYDPVYITIGSNHVQIDLDSPIAAVSWDSNGNPCVRVYYSFEGHLKQAGLDNGQSASYNGGGWTILGSPFKAFY